MRRRGIRIGLLVTSAALALVAGSAVAGMTPEAPAPTGKAAKSTKPHSQTLTLGSLKAPASGAKSDGRTLRLRRNHTEDFSAYAVSWASDAGTVTVKGRVRQDGAWQSWRDLGVDPGATDAERTGVDLMWTGPSDGVEVKVTAVSGRKPRQLKLHLIDPGEAPVDALAATAQADLAPSAARPKIYTRADWGADESKMGWDPEYAPSLVAITLHHTAGENAYTAADVPGIIRSIYQYQAVELGWGDIGYNVLVDKFGRLWEGRYGGLDRPLIGGHAYGFNTGTAGIAILGHHSTTAVSKEVVTAASKYVAWRFTPDRIDPRAKTQMTSAGNSKYPQGTVVTVGRVFAHRDTNATECPGDQGMVALTEIRERAYRYLMLPGRTDPGSGGTLPGR